MNEAVDKFSLLNRLAESFDVYLAVFFQHACFDEEVLGLRKVFYVSIGDGRVEIVPASHSLYLVFREARFRGGCAVVFLRICQVVFDDFFMGLHEFLCHFGVLFDKVAAHGNDDGGIEEAFARRQDAGAVVFHFQCRR